MQHPRLRAQVFVGLACLFVGYGATVVAQQGTPDPARRRNAKPLKIGVVDIGVLFQQYKRKDDLEKAINDDRERMRKDVETDQERVRKMREALDNGPYRRGSEPWMEQADRIKLEQAKLEMKEQRLQSSLKQRVEEFTLQILSELEATVASYGTSYDYTAIFKVDSGSRQETGGGALAEQFQERIFRAQISDVIFHEDGIDCTESVLKLLNSADNVRKMEEMARERESARAAGAAASSSQTEKKDK